MKLSRKPKKANKNKAGNHFYKILRLLDVLPNIFFPSQVKRSTISTYHHGIQQLPHELSTNLGLRILGD